MKDGTVVTDALMNFLINFGFYAFRVKSPRRTDRWTESDRWTDRRVRPAMWPHRMAEQRQSPINSCHRSLSTAKQTSSCPTEFHPFICKRIFVQLY